MLRKLLVANRGEIAVRVIRAARDLGIATVAVYSDADRDSLHVQIADEAVHIGPPAAKKSYLNVASILKAATDTGCDSVHPDYGFLAENAGFADACAEAGLVFVGPSGDAIRTMGDKVAARSAAHAAGVPVVPGSLGRVAGIDAARHVLIDTGFPVMIKSLQRRRQKVWEEAPSRALPARVRDELCSSAVRLARAVGYSGAGTVEYLFDDESGRFYFIEMNTRIQVEHPVTEMITGIDLVAEMLRIAGGEPLRLRQSDITVRGHAIEVRLNAEDPSRDFAPFPGTVTALRVPGGPGVRFESMLYAGYTVPPFYDSLLAKLVVHAETREAAITRLVRALSETRIDGLRTTKPLFLALAGDPAVQANAVHTRWLEGWLETHAARLVPEPEP